MVALQFFEDDKLKNSITIFLAGSFVTWLLLAVAFFCTIDRSYLHTFTNFQTAGETEREIFKNTKFEDVKFSAAFDSRMSYMTPIKDDVKDWVGTCLLRI